MNEKNACNLVKFMSPVYFFCGSYQCGIWVFYVPAPDQRFIQIYVSHIYTYLHQKETHNKGLQNYPDKSSVSISILFINSYYFILQGLFSKEDARKIEEKEINYKIFSF